MTEPTRKPPTNQSLYIHLAFSALFFSVAFYAYVTGKGSPELTWATMSGIVAQWAPSPLDHKGKQ